MVWSPYSLGRHNIIQVLEMPGLLYCSMNRQYDTQYTKYSLGRSYCLLARETLAN